MFLLTTVDVLSRMRFDVERSSVARQIGAPPATSRLGVPASAPGAAGRHG